jgi:hypothetical protein
MPTIYISDSGDDKNDGLSLQTAVYSLRRAKKLQGGRNAIAGTSGREHGSVSQSSFPTRNRSATRATLQHRVLLVALVPPLLVRRAALLVPS